MNIKYNYLIGNSYEKIPDDYLIDERIDPDTCGCEELYNDLLNAFLVIMK